MGRRVTRGQRNIAWIEKHCRVPEGMDVGKPVRLRRWQKRDIRKIYDNPAGTRQAILSFARKNGKTALAAMLLLLHLCGPESVINSQLYSAAMSRDQAALTYALAAKMARMSPTLHEVLVIRDTVKQIYCPERGTLYRALSAEASTAFGLSPAFIIHDELGQVRGSRSPLYEALETAEGAHPELLSVIISTQAQGDGDLLSILIDDALAGHDPQTVISLYTAPKDAPPFQMRTARRANPAFGDFLDAALFKKSAEKARRMPSLESGFRNLKLNQRVSALSPFISLGVWNQNAAAPTEAAFRTAPITVALDLSARNDLTALLYSAEIGLHYHVRAEFFAPLEGIRERSMKDRVPYDLWAEQGFITATPGWSVRYAAIADRLAELAEEYEIERVLFDRWRIDVLEAALEDVGLELPLVPFGQGYKDMAPALDSIESELLDGKVRHGGNPVLTMCVSNAMVDRNPSTGDRKLHKMKSTGRIDGATAMVMLFGTPSVESEEHVTGSLVAV